MNIQHHDINTIGSIVYCIRECMEGYIYGHTNTNTHFYKFFIYMCDFIIRTKAVHIFQSVCILLEFEELNRVNTCLKLEFK